ncbi:hypothetical protein LH407_07440 [Antiquaquibacter oligotrophicus]|nr:hypothetical protein [Antiquaquibacter oligotrophicus]UDF12005.1 hypothetical protein LH407_07440 [Antiquaquibacter oligotrophicus]
MLAIALRNAVNAFNTRRVVLGGFLGDLFALDPEPFESLRSGTHLLGAQMGIEIVEAQLGHSGALLGAAELVFRPLLDDPTMIGTAERRGAAVSEVVRLRRHEESELAV